MSKVDDIQILDDIELGDIVGGVTRKKKATKKKVVKKKVVKKPNAVTKNGNLVTVSANALEHSKGLDPL